VIFWSLAVVTWGYIFARPERAAREAPVDPIHVTGSRTPPPEVKERQESPLKVTTSSAYVAIVIDDFGPTWDAELIRGFTQFPAPLTISVIPGNRKSAEIARQADDAGKEVFIHMPMEPTERVALDERDMLWVKSTRAQIAHTLDRARHELPQAVGLNNHMGSRATADASLMELVAAEVRSRGLIFVDSRTSERSEALRMMEQAGVTALGRDVFLDIKPDSASVSNRLKDLSRIAHRRGLAIGIGHVRWGTLRALKAVLPVFKREGIRLITVSELASEIGATGRVQ
jgi:polysaccharide deacetylase 2 family uncharacterized protein YibQ